MNKNLLILFFSFVTTMVFCQSKSIEINGSIRGEYKDKIYLFFENEIASKDSLSATIQNGLFHFSLKHSLPVLCRVHFGDKSTISEFYVDNTKTSLLLNGKLTEKEIPDSLGGARSNFEIVQINGSATDSIIRSFKNWAENLQKTEEPDAVKHSLYYKKLEAFIKAHPAGKAGMYLITEKVYMLGKAFMFGGRVRLTYAEIRSLSHLLDPSVKHTLEFENLSKVLSSLEKNNRRKLNNPFHDTKLPDSSNQLINTRSFRNKYVLIDVWASWCKPCRAMTPELQKIYKTYQPKGFEIIAISLDEKKTDWINAIKQDNPGWIQLIDPDNIQGELCLYYDIRAIPAQILVNKEGKVIAFPGSPAEIEKILSGLL